jgi:hypothetical protein
MGLNDMKKSRTLAGAMLWDHMSEMTFPHLV